MRNTPSVPPLIGATDLQQLLGTPDLLVVDCRFDLANPDAGGEAYVAGHIPGAVFAPMEHDLSAQKRPDTGRHPLPAARDFAAVLGRWGFTETSHVVAYDQANGASAARLWWMLRARGHRHVQVLDGGWSAWLAAGGAADTKVPAAASTTVQEREFAGLLDAAQLQAALSANAITLVDARTAERFAGRSETVDPVAGHVPGALNHPFADNLGEQQRWLDAGELRRRWALHLADSAKKPMVMMCGSGITACHNLLALELAGHSGAQLYAGSWSEWITDRARPVATGE